MAEAGSSPRAGSGTRDTAWCARGDRSSSRLGRGCRPRPRGHEVVDRRRIELIEPGVPTAPIEHEIEPLLDGAAAGMVAGVRALGAAGNIGGGWTSLRASLPGPLVSVSLRAWPLRLSVRHRRPAPPGPYASRADSVMYCQVLAECADERGWAVHFFDAQAVEAQAARILGVRAGDVLHGPRATLGPPWTKDHRIALAATIVAGGHSGGRSAREPWVPRLPLAARRARPGRLAEIRWR